MKLYELVSLRNTLRDSLDLDTILKGIEANQGRLTSIVPHANEHYGQKINDLSINHYKIFEYAKQDADKINSLLEEIDQDIDKLTKKFFEDNYQTECFSTDYNFLRNHKVMHMSDESRDALLSRIHLYSTWKYPALEIGCRDGEWTKHLVTFDPLYVADNHHEFLDSAISQFTPEYQKRVQQYHIQDFKIYPSNQFGHNYKTALPLNQIGFIFSYNYFNYLSLDSIKQFLVQAHECLRPGGTLLFTYNNADMSASAGLTEGYFMTYVPKSMLVPMAESLGFDIAQCFDFLPSTSWIELRKPGSLTTVKAHQALGEIKFK
jgi:SAM-dependent methyltransferase